MPLFLAGNRANMAHAVALAVAETKVVVVYIQDIESVAAVAAVAVEIAPPVDNCNLSLWEANIGRAGPSAEEAVDNLAAFVELRRTLLTEENPPPYQKGENKRILAVDWNEIEVLAYHPPHPKNHPFALHHSNTLANWEAQIPFHPCQFPP